MLRLLATALAGLTTFYWWVHLAAAARRMMRARFVVRADTHPPVDPAAAPTVSVLIPARDEEAVIGRCLDALLAQDHPLHEVIVIDDRSRDGTAAEVDRRAAADPRLRRVAGAPLPAGWKGKNHALHQGAREATGEWLLFVDADVRLAPQAVRQAVAEATAHGADLLSWFAQLELRTWWERQLMPFIADFIVLFSPLDRVNDPAHDDCIANGQFILVRGDVYRRVGGHAVNRASIIDDVSLARAVKGAGWRVRMVYALGLMQTRMYSTFAEIWNGWAKNVYPAMQRRPGLAVAAVVYLLLSGVAPAVLLPFAVASMLAGQVGAFEQLAVAAAVGIVAYRTLVWRVDPGAQGWAHVLLHPFQALALAGIIVDSVARAHGGRRTRWKDRSYDDGRDG